MFVLNLACRDPNLRNQIVQDIRSVFKSIWSYRVPEEVNEILFCTDNNEIIPDPKSGAKKEKKVLIEAFKKVNGHTKVVQKSCNARNEEELLDLDEAMKQLKLENI